MEQATGGTRERRTPMFFKLKLSNNNMNLRPVSVVTTKNYTHSHSHIIRTEKEYVPFHDRVPGQSNHRKYSQDKSSQHNNKTSALWAVTPA